MPSFIGAAGADTITTTFVSGGVVTSGGSLPGAGDDAIVGHGGADLLDGGAGDDRFFWSTGDGADVVEGGAGIDNQALKGAGFIVSASGDHALVKIGAETVDLHGVEGIKLQAGAGFANFEVGDLRATDVDQVLIQLNLEDGTPNLIGLAGAATADTITVQTFGVSSLRVLDSAGGAVQTTVISGLTSQDRVTVNGAGGGDNIALTTPGGDVSAAVMIARGGDGDDSLTGSIGGDVLMGDAGNDLIKGGGGGDTIDGGAGLDTLSVTGGVGSDAVTLTAAGGHVLEVVGGSTTDVVNVETISVRLLGQADTITIGDLSSAGVKTLNLDLSGTNGAEDGQADRIILAPPSADTAVTFTSAANGSSVQAVYSRQGAVVQTVNISALGAADAVVQAGGAADDVFSTTAFASHLRVAVDAGAGANTENFTATTGNDTVSLTANGTHAELTLNGSAPLDLVNIQRVRVFALEGQDNVQVGDLRGTDVRDVTVDLARSDGHSPGSLGKADGQADAVTLNYATSGALKLDISSSPDHPGGTGGFTDISVTDANTPGLAQRAAVSGMDGQDQVIVNLSSNGLTTVRGDAGAATLHFGAGGDQINWSLLAEQHDRAKVDGDAGSDSISFFFNDFEGSQDEDSWSVSLLPQGSHSLLHLHHLVPPDAANPTGLLIDSDFDLSNVEDVAVRGGAASDTFLIFDQAGTAVRHVDLDAGGGAPDGARDFVVYDTTSGADNVTVRISQTDLVVETPLRSLTVHNLDASDSTIIRTGDGDDRIDLQQFFQRFQGRVIVDTGTGNDTIIGGAGPATFDFSAGGGGTDMVFNFAGEARGGHDVIQVLGGPDHSFADLVNHNHLIQIGSDVFLSDGAGALMVLKGVSMFDVGAGDFSF